MSSSLNTSKRKTPKASKSNKLESKEAEEIFQKGLENIYQSFNLIHKNYKDKISFLEKEVNILSQKIETQKKEIEMIQRENKYYKEKNVKLKNEVEKLNKIVDNIKGKLTNGDDELSRYIKTDKIKNGNLRKFYSKNNSKYKNNNNLYLYNTYKNTIYNDNKKNEKSKLLHFYMNNNSSLNYNLDNKRKVESNSTLELLSDLNQNNNYEENVEKYRYQNSFQNKYKTAHASREEKIKKNNFIEKSDDIPSKTLNNKNRSYSSNKYIEEKENNKIQNEDSEINNDDINIKELNNILISNNNNDDINKQKSKNKKLEQKVCLTYDNLFMNNHNIKEIKKNKNTYNTFRGKVFNKNTSDNYIKNERKQEQDNEKANFFLSKCKVLLDKESVEKIVNVFKDYKEGLITDKGIISKIEKYIWNNNELIELFNKIFSK